MPLDNDFTCRAGACPSRIQSNNCAGIYLPSLHQPYNLTRYFYIGYALALLILLKIPPLYGKLPPADAFVSYVQNKNIFHLSCLFACGLLSFRV
jgi:hypothetical protein